MKGVGVSWGRAELKAGGASAPPDGELTAGGVSWGRAELKAGGKAAGLDEGILSFCLPYSRLYVESP
jgi:hypothetical protein